MQQTLSSVYHHPVVLSVKYRNNSSQMDEVVQKWKNYNFQS